MSQHTELVVQLWVWDNSLQSKLNKTIEANSQANQTIKCEIEKNINYKKISKNKISQPRLLWLNWRRYWDNLVEIKTSKKIKLGPNNLTSNDKIK